MPVTAIDPTAGVAKWNRIDTAVQYPVKKPTSEDLFDSTADHCLCVVFRTFGGWYSRYRRHTAAVSCAYGCTVEQ